MWSYTIIRHSGLKNEEMQEKIDVSKGQWRFWCKDEDRLDRGKCSPGAAGRANIRHPPKNYDVGKEAALAYSISKVSNGSKRLESKNFRTCVDWKFVLAHSITLRLIEPFDPHLSWHTTPGCLYGVFLGGYCRHLTRAEDWSAIRTHTHFTLLKNPF